MQIKVLFTPAEAEQVREAAAREHMAAAAWLGRLGSAAARGSPADAARARQLTRVLADLEAAVALGRRCGGLLNQAVARLHSTGQHDDQLAENAATVAGAARRMETAVLRATRILL